MKTKGILISFEDDIKFWEKQLVYLRTGPSIEVQEFTGRNLMKFIKGKDLYFGQKNAWHRYKVENNWQDCLYLYRGGEQAKQGWAEEFLQQWILIENCTGPTRIQLVGWEKETIAGWQLEYCNALGPSSNVKNDELQGAQQRSTKKAHEKGWSTCEARLRTCLE